MMTECLSRVQKLAISICDYSDLDMVRGLWGVGNGRSPFNILKMKSTAIAVLFVTPTYPVEIELHQLFLGANLLHPIVPNAVPAAFYRVCESGNKAQ